MRRNLIGMALLLTAPLASGAIRYVEIDTADDPATSAAENGCPAWVLEANDDDCSYDGGKPLELGNSQWVGPVFSAGYYPPGGAPQIFANTDLGAGPVSAPAPELPPGDMVGIPIARGFISIDDFETPAAIDDVIGGTLEFGSFQRNVAVSAGARVVESIDRVIHRISRVRVSSATPNGSGGFDYVVARAGTVSAFPDPLSGSTTYGGGFTQAFTSEIASQSTPDPLDLPFWEAPGAHGLAALDDTSAVLGSTSTATVWGFSCDDGNATPGGCATTGINWDGDNRVAFNNVLLKISTNSSGDVLSANAFLVQESDLSQTAEGKDSWTASRLVFVGTSTSLPAAFDDRRIIEVVPNAFLPSIFANVLANDRMGVEPVTVTIITPPAEGSATVSSAASSLNQIRYTAGSATPGEQLIVYEMTDANNATATAELHILVTNPVSCEDDVATGQRDADVTVDVTANDSGFDLPPIVVGISAAPEAGTTIINPDRTITFTPPPDTGGIFNINYSLTDGANRPSVCSIRIQIPARPEAVDDAAGLSVDSTKSIDVLANDIEVTDTPLLLTIVTEPGHGTATVDTTGATPKIHYTPTAAYTGADTLTYTVTDADADVSGIATVAISVFGPPQNDLPACANDTIDADRDISATIDVLANDTGLNAAPIVVEIIETTFPDPDSAVVNPDNTITFTPPVGTGGTFYIDYRAREALNDTVQCYVTVKVDDLPIANDDELYGVNFGQIGSVGLLSNDTGLQDRPIALEITQQPTHGTLLVCDAPSAECADFTTGSLPFVTYTYDDPAGYPAVDTFRYQLRDADGDTSEIATVTVTPKSTLTAEDDLDGLRTASGYSITVNVLANDGGLLRTPLVVTLESTEAGGKAVVNADNTVTFTARADFTGLSGFTYRLTDADDNSDTAFARVIVFPTPVTDTGGSSFDWSLVALLGAGLVLRRRSRRPGRPPAA